MWHTQFIMYDYSENLTQEVQRVCVSQELQQQLNRCRNRGSLTMQLGSVADLKNVF
jgi:hypothetical protein